MANPISDRWCRTIGRLWMHEKPVERRLAAILVADVVGYSRLMGADEVGTLRALKAHRRELIDPVVAAHRGRIVKSTGDGLLLEFPSAVEAVACAVMVQRGLASRNESVPEEKRLTFRVGINVGDVIVETHDIFGDGVNVAARLETMCEPGGLCISRAVRDQVRDKLPVVFADLGDQTVKNIARPVRAFGLTPQAVAAAPELVLTGGARPAPRWRAWIGAAFALIVVAVSASAWWLGQEPSTAPKQPIDAGLVTTPASPQRASVAVLPFASLTPADNDDYFADGLTEDIILALGRFRELSVISRGGVSAYKGKDPAPEEVGRDLQVRYVVEGSVRRSPERIRVSVNLTDTARSTLLWSEQYDVKPEDIFPVQDQITRQISGALAIQVTGVELAQSAAKPPSNLEAYDLVLRGRDAFARITRSGNAEARELFTRAIELDPNYAPAYVGLANVDLKAVTQGWTPNPGEALERAEGFARKAIELDESNPGAHAVLGNVAVYFGEYDRGLRELKRAIDLNPSDAEAYGGLVGVLLWTGDVEGAISAGELLAQFQPNLTATESFHLATAYLLADRSSDAIGVLEQARDRNRADPFAHVILAAAYAEQGQQEAAKQQAGVVRQRYPTFSREEFGSLLRDQSQRQKLALALEKAGL